jgi:hypothetical protein
MPIIIFGSAIPMFTPTFFSCWIQCFGTWRWWRWELSLYTITITITMHDTHNSQYKGNIEHGAIPTEVGGPGIGVTIGVTIGVELAVGGAILRKVLGSAAAIVLAVSFVGLFVFVAISQIFFFFVGLLSRFFQHR